MLTILEFTLECLCEADEVGDAELLGAEAELGVGEEPGVLDAELVEQRTDVVAQRLAARTASIGRVRCVHRGK